MYLFQSLSWFLDFELYPFCRPKNTLEAIGLCGPMLSFKLNSPDKSEPSKVTRQWTTRGHTANISPQQLSLTHYSQTQAIFLWVLRLAIWICEWDITIFAESKERWIQITNQVYVLVVSESGVRLWPLISVWDRAAGVFGY